MGYDLPLLSAQERSRADAIHHPGTRRGFIRTRAAKRRILGAYLDAAPDRIRLETGARGKPRLAAPQPGLHFNLTHSGELTLLGVSRDGPIGVDAERMRSRHGLMAIARRMFGVETAAVLSALPEAARLVLFHLHWTRLEAGVKATGSGLFAGSEHPVDMYYANFIPAPQYIACIAARFALPDPGTWETFEYRPPAMAKAAGNSTIR
jgi:4'-phosphopantetheinyl transferase